MQPTDQRFPLRAWALWFIVLVGLAFGLWKRLAPVTPASEGQLPSPIAAATTTAMNAPSATAPAAEPEAAIERSLLGVSSDGVTSGSAASASNEAKLERAIAAASVCVPSLASQPGRLNISSLGDMNRELSSALGGPGRREFGWLNAHVRDGDGRETRLRIVGEATPDGKEALKFQVFGVDEEGLPVPQKIPAAHAHRPSPEIVRHYMPAGSSLKFLEKGYDLSFAGGAQARVIEAQGRVKQLELTSANHVLRCTESITTGLSCACL